MPASRVPQAKERVLRPPRSWRSRRSARARTAPARILRANVLTRFNAILGTLLVVVVAVGPPQDALFGIVLVVNTGFGVAQELRAKRTLDRLAILTAARDRVERYDPGNTFHINQNISPASGSNP